MKTVGAFEAKTHLSQLLEEVAAGETITITRRGVPVARLVPAWSGRRRHMAAVLRDIEDIRAQIGTDTGLSVREMIEDGRA